MNFESDIVIVGSGPAGVSAAWPLVEAGLKVTMVDVGREESAQTLRKDDGFANIRRYNPRQSEIFVGSNFRALDSVGPSSPKFRAPTNSYVFEDYNQKYNIRAKNFVVAGSLSAGGLSNAWGAGVSRFDDKDLQSFPIAAKDLEPSYNHIIARIGVSGANDDMGDFHGNMLDLQSPLEIDPNSGRLFERYKKNKKIALSRGMQIGRTRHAVLSKKHLGRELCAYCGLCLWGCAYKSVYSSSQDLKFLKAKSNFQYRDKIFVERLTSEIDGYKLHGTHTDSSSKVVIPAKQLILACGAIGSSKLVHEAMEMFNLRLPVLTTPIVLFAMSIPEKIGRPISGNGFAMGQLSFRVNDEHCPEGYSFGSTFHAETILTSELINRVPLSYPLSRNLIRLMQSSMLLGNCFLSGSYGNHSMRLTKNGELTVHGEYKRELKNSIARIRRRISTVMGLYRIAVLPGSFSVTLPGEDMHYAGTLPMKKHPARNETFPNGEVAGLPGVYVVDGASLTSLPAKSHTLTIMANADRIARELILRAK